MRIAVNAHRLIGQQAGVSRYLKEIIFAWKAAQIEDQIDLICPGSGHNLSSYEWEHCHAIETGAFQRTIIWENLVLPHYVKDADILFCPSYFVPIKCGVPTVVTIHDVIHEVYPKSVPFYWRWRLHWGMLWTAKKAAAVITVSECSKRDICRFYKVNPDKVFVTYEGVGSQFKQLDHDYAINSLSEQFGIKRPFILYVGSITPRRNIERLIQAFCSASSKLQGFSLVLAGKDFQKLNLAKSNGDFFRENRIKYLDQPSDEQLLLLYNAAEYFIYPSSYEGFGLPVLEAMACGTPVITGNNSSLKEIAGEAAHLVDVSNNEEIMDALVLLANNKEYQSLLRERGLKRVKSFSWDVTATKTLEILKQAGR